MTTGPSAALRRTAHNLATGTLTALAAIAALATLCSGVHAGGTFTVFGNQGKASAVNTGIVLSAGDPLTITATGEVNWTNPGGSLHDPDGLPGCFPAGGSSWLPGQCRMSLTAQIGGTVFTVGSAYSGVAPASGTLLLGTNDDFYGDNQGHFTVNVETPPKGRPHKIVFYVDLSGEQGHTFVGFVPAWGPQKGQTLRFGKYPGESNALYGHKAEIFDDQHTPWVWRITYYVSTKDYNAAVAKVNGDDADPDHTYHLIFSNCTDWIVEVAEAAGLELPDEDELEVASPATLGLSMAALGDCGTFNGGTVELNNKSSMLGSACTSWDPIEVAKAAHIAPLPLATTMGLGSSDVDLGSFALQSAASLFVDLSNVDPSAAFYTVDWGDGSPLDAHSLSFEHAYAVDGSYVATVAIIDAGTVRRYGFQVDVSPLGDAPAVVDIVVPTPTPAIGNANLCDPPISLSTPLADATVENGNDVNPLGLASVTPPSLDTTWELAFDASHDPNAFASFLLVYESALGVPVLLAEGELLVDLTSFPHVVLTVPLVSGLGAASLPVPANPALAGYEFVAQAGSVGSAVELHNALSVLVGY